MSRILAVMLLAVMVVAVVGGCEEAPAQGMPGNPRARGSGIAKAHVPHFGPAAVKPEAPFIAAQERFACKLLQEMRRQQPEGNLFFSPTSLNLALAMIANGTRGDTLAAILKTLEWQDLDTARINAGCEALMAGLKLRTGEPTLYLTNALWARQGLTPVPAFTQTMDRVYHAPLRTLDLNDTVAAAREVNQWANTETQGMIPEVVTPKDLEDVFMVLANALFFEGKWTIPFIVEDTKPGPFHLADGTEKRVPFMQQEGRYLHLELPEFQAISLPYNSGRLSCYVFFPAEGTGLQEFLPTVTAANWADWQGAFAEREGTLKLPRFGAEYGEHLKDILTALGMGPAFAPSGDWTPMVAGVSAYLTDVIHKAIIEVNEQGTRAAAVAMGMPGGFAPPVTTGPFTMTVDRPFLCAIRDNGTGALLFMGVITDPEKLSR